MPNFSYIAGTREGKTLNGRIEADTELLASDKLRKQGYYILNLKKASQIGPIDIEEVKKKMGSLFGSELGAVERMMFTAHLASMLKAGVPIIEAIGTFEDKNANNRRQRMYHQIIADLESGRPLSSALGRYPKTFFPIYTHIVASGESMGTLGETLRYLGDQLRKDHELTGRVRGAMIYPAVVMTIMFLVLGFITFSVVPKLLTFTQSIGTELPLATRILMNGTSFLIAYGIWIFIAVVIGVVLLTKFLKTTRGKEYYDGVMFHLPLFGELARRFNLARFSRLLGAFYHYGIPLPTAFSILTSALPNLYYQRAAENLKDRMSHGMSLAEALDKEPENIMPRLLVRVIRSAEKSATVDEALWRMADYYEEELDGTLKNLTTIIEPVLILILGVAVTGIALAVIVPIYQVTTKIG